MLSRLLRHDRFVLTTHIRPDGDAIGSELGLAAFLRKLGRDVTIINSDPPTYNLSWLPGVESIHVFDGSLVQLQSVAEAGALVVVDTNAIDRLGRFAPTVKNAQCERLLIDHHTNPEAWFDATFVRDTASSTGELVYELICEHDADLIDADIATVLYTAIMTDTGSFRYNSVTPRVHRIVADLLDRGDIRPAPIHASVFDTRSMEGTRLLGRALETITLSFDGQLAYMVVSQRMVHETNSSLEETEGFVNYALSIEGVKAAVIFSETESGVKMSFRSKGKTHVNEWARSFGGGGHRNAAGAYVTRSLEETITAVIAAAPRYLDLEVDHAKEDELSAEDASYLDALMKRQENLLEP
ncbi:MAG TPA: bifunctional oligoribonuclease/PAP phosphatase NrnA [Rhodothermales bacterium]